jgi:protein involved in polysaccharide export with SLBB domain
LKYPAIVLILGLVTLSTADAQQPTVLPSAEGTPATLPNLRPGDIVRLRIWREPDLSGDFPVDEHGRANFPLVGAYPVTTETRESLQQKLVAAYRTSVANLSMDVIFLRRVAVTGAVRTGGLFPVDPTMSVGDAIALAGGSTVDLTRTKIQLIRSGKPIIADVDAALLISQLPIERGDQLYIPPRDSFIERNPWVIGTLVQSVVAVVTAVVTLSR